MALSSRQVAKIQRWMIDLLRVCKDNNIVLRVLEGTPSHDRNQSVQFDVLNEAMDSVVDCRYMEGLSVEYIESLGISLLYVPDEYSVNLDTTYDHAYKAVKQAGLDKVDLGVTHGFFTYQVPKGLPIPAHREERYLSLVKHYIFNGHDHVSSSKDRIRVQGSFDGLIFGEPEEKGYWEWEIDLDDPTQDSSSFVVNKGALPYIDIDASEIDTKHLFNAIEKRLNELPDGAWVRFLHDGNEKKVYIFDAIKQTYPQFNFRHKNTTKSKKAKEPKQSMKVPENTIVTLNRHNVRSQVRERLSNILDVPETERIVGQLEEYLDAVD